MKKALTGPIWALLGLVIGYYLGNTNQEITPVSYAGEVSKQTNQTGLNAVEGKTAELKQKISDVHDEVQRLEALNEALSNQIANMNLPGVVPSNYPELVAKLDKLPISVIEDQLGRFLNADQLERIEDPRKLSKRLLEVALEEQKIDDERATADIIFSTSPVYGKNIFAGRLDLASSDAVFAHIISQGPLSDIVVKWQNMQTGEIHSFRGNTIEHSGFSPYVWLRPPEGWRAGRYTVSIHALDQEVSFVGANAFEVASVSESAGNELSGRERIIQDLIASGQAVQKQ